MNFEVRGDTDLFDGGSWFFGIGVGTANGIATFDDVLQDSNGSCFALGVSALTTRGAAVRLLMLMLIATVAVDVVLRSLGAVQSSSATEPLAENVPHALSGSVRCVGTRARHVARWNHIHLEKYVKYHLELLARKLNHRIHRLNVVNYSY